MTVGRAISPECSTDEKTRMAERSGGLGHIVTPADRLARIAHDAQHGSMGRFQVVVATPHEELR